VLLDVRLPVRTFRIHEQQVLLDAERSAKRTHQADGLVALPEDKEQRDEADDDPEWTRQPRDGDTNQRADQRKKSEYRGKPECPGQ
jgi:hypothetical protein